MLPARAAVVEDAVAGVEAGARGGFALIIGVDRRAKPESLVRAGASTVVADLAALAVEPVGPGHARLVAAGLAPPRSEPAPAIEAWVWRTWARRRARGARDLVHPWQRLFRDTRAAPEARQDDTTLGHVCGWLLQPPPLLGASRWTTESRQFAELARPRLDRRWRLLGRLSPTWTPTGKSSICQECSPADACD